MVEVSATLPYPPSANKIWRFVKGSSNPLKSEAYRQWLSAADAAIPMSARGQVRGRHRVSIRADRPDRRARDLDNLIKPTLDAIKDGKWLKGLVRDDADMIGLTIDWTGDEPVADAKVHVVVTEVAQ